VKVRSVEKIQKPETIKYELIMKRNRRYILTEGSLLECGNDVKKQVQILFDRPPHADLTEIGMIVIDNDDRYRKFLHRAKFNSELDQLDNHTFKTVLNEHAGDSTVRTALKESLAKLIKSRLGLIVDSVGDSFDSVVTKKKHLESMGYDCTVCFVNMSLNEVMARRNGTGIVSDEQASELWRETQKNIARYAETFGGNIVVIDGSSPEKFVKGVEFAVEQFVTEPVKNDIGQNLMIRSRTAHSGE